VWYSVVSGNPFPETDAVDLLHDFQLHTANELAKWLKRTASAAELAAQTCQRTGKVGGVEEQARAVGIVSQDVLQTKIEYVHQNAIRWKLVDDPAEWPWSSWRSYHLGDKSLLRVDRVEMV
jgi:hypothetical protein